MTGARTKGTPRRRGPFGPGAGRVSGNSSSVPTEAPGPFGTTLDTTTPTKKQRHTQIKRRSTNWGFVRRGDFDGCKDPHPVALVVPSPRKRSSTPGPRGNTPSSLFSVTGWPPTAEHGDVRHNDEFLTCPPIASAGGGLSDRWSVARRGSSPGPLTDPDVTGSNRVRPDGVLGPHGQNPSGGVRTPTDGVDGVES